MTRSWGAVLSLFLLSVSLNSGTGTPEMLRIFPQFVIGGGFEAVLIITNSADDPWSGSIRIPGFAAPDAIAWFIDGEEHTGSDTLALDLPARGTVRMLFHSTPESSFQAGALEIRPDQFNSVETLASTLFYNFSVNGELIDSIGVAGAPAAYQAVLPVEQSVPDRIGTGVALRIDSEEAGAAGSATPLFTATLFDRDGITLGQVQDDLRGARFVDQFFESLDLGQQFIGSLHIESDNPFYVVALRQQILSGGRFQLTGVPPRLDLEPPAPPTFSARYRVTFDASWSAQTHPVEFPAGPHFSSLIGGTHRQGTIFWRPGILASDGIEEMAELGGTSLLRAEVEIAMVSDLAGAVLQGGGIGTSPGSVSFEFDIDQDFPLVSLVSMIAPSPDWFVGVYDLQLFRNGRWVNRLVVPLQPYDAGTDSGTTYNSPNLDTQPPQPVEEITGNPFLNGETVPPMGTFTFTRIDQ